MGILHFLDVGQGDCSIIEHRSGRTTMIDVCKARTVKTTIASLYAPPPPSAAAALGLLGSAMPQQALSPAARDLLNALLPPPPDFVDPIEYMRARATFPRRSATSKAIPKPITWMVSPTCAPSSRLPIFGTPTTPAAKQAASPSGATGVRIGNSTFQSGMAGRLAVPSGWYSMLVTKGSSGTQ